MWIEAEVMAGGSDLILWIWRRPWPMFIDSSLSENSSGDVLRQNACFYFYFFGVLQFDGG